MTIYVYCHSKMIFKRFTFAFTLAFVLSSLPTSNPVSRNIPVQQWYAPVVKACSQHTAQLPVHYCTCWARYQRFILYSWMRLPGNTTIYQLAMLLGQFTSDIGRQFHIIPSRRKNYCVKEGTNPEWVPGSER